MTSNWLSENRHRGTDKTLTVKAKWLATAKWLTLKAKWLATAKWLTLSIFYCNQSINRSTVHIKRKKHTQHYKIIKWVSRFKSEFHHLQDLDSCFPSMCATVWYGQLFRQLLMSTTSAHNSGNSFYSDWSRWCASLSIVLDWLAVYQVLCNPMQTHVTINVMKKLRLSIVHIHIPWHCMAQNGAIRAHVTLRCYWHADSP